MTEEEAVNLIASAAQAASQLAVLIPSLVSNWQAVREGLAATDTAALNDKIVAAHADIQALDAQLAAIRRN